MASDAVVNLVVNATDAESQVNIQLRRIVNDAERSAPAISLQVNIDNASVVNAINALGDRINTVNRDADRSTRGLTDTFTGLAGGIGRAVAASTRLVAIGGIASQAIPLVAGLATAVESLVPAAAAGVAAFVTVKAAALTLQLGLTGVQDAITAVFDPDADPAAVAEAMEKLSGNARAFVSVLQTMRPAFDRLRLDVQDRLFEGLDRQLSLTARSTFPELRAAARSFADTFNEMARGVASGAQQVGDNGTLGRALSQGTTAFSKLERIPGQVLVAVTQLAAAGGPLLNRFTDRIVDLADSASKALEGAFESGALEDAVNAAGDALAQLGRIAGNVFGILGNLMDAAGESGQGLFGALEQVTGALEDLTASDQFQDTLGALIEVGQELISAVLPLLEEAFLALAPAIQILAPYVQDIIELLGEKLAELIPELAPVLAELATLFGEILVAVAPLIEQGIQLLIELMPDLIPLFESLIELVGAIAPLIEYFAVGAKELLVPALSATIAVLDSLVQATILVVGAINYVIEWIGKFALSLTNQADPGIRATTQLLNGDFQGALETTGGVVQRFGLRVAAQLEQMAGTSTRYINQLASDIIQRFNRWISDVQGQVNRFGSTLLGYFIRIRDSTVSTVNGWVSSFRNAGANIMRGLVDGILSQLGPAISAANRVVGAIRDFFPSSPAKRGPFSGRGYPFFSGQEVVNSFARGIESRVSTARRAINGTLGGALIPASAGTNPLAGLEAGPGYAGIANTPFARLTPNINVSVLLGNDQLLPYFQAVVDEDTLQRDRLAAQGTRI